CLNCIRRVTNPRLVTRLLPRAFTTRKISVHAMPLCRRRGIELAHCDCLGRIDGAARDRRISMKLHETQLETVDVHGDPTRRIAGVHSLHRMIRGLRVAMLTTLT